MPLLTRVYVKTSLAYFLLALLAGLLIALQSAGLARWTLAGIFPVYLHLFVLGWITQLIFGVVYWMFPKFSRDLPRGRVVLAWFAYAALNLGLVLRTVAEPLNAISPSPAPGWALAASALLLWLAGAAFTANTWKRVKEK